MNKAELRDDMKRYVNGSSFINLHEVIEYLGYSQNSAKEVKSRFLTGLDKVGRYYFIPDVVERVMQARSMD